jgi:hypothetical protein
MFVSDHISSTRFTEITFPAMVPADERTGAEENREDGTRRNPIVFTISVQ